MTRFPSQLFYETVRANPFWSTWTCFAEVIMGRDGLSIRTIRKNFDALIDRNDYSKSDKFQLSKYLSHLSQN